MPAIPRLMPLHRLLVLLLLCAANPAIAVERHALIIGNAAYQGEAPLKNTLNDARDMAKLLDGLGFEIAEGGALENAGRKAMARAINRFLSRVRSRDGIVLIYYSGHGMRDRFDANYLIPNDAQIEQEADVRIDGIALSGILDQLNERPRGSVSLVMVDACRNNPFAAGKKGGKRGLGRVDPARSTLLLYSASPGQQADDNQTGRNGLFTKHLLGNLAHPGLDVEDAFDAVSLAVEQDSGGEQVPWSGGNLRGKVYLAGEPSGSEGDSGDYDLIAWQDAKRCGRQVCYQAYLNDFPHGRFRSMAKAMSLAVTAPPVQPAPLLPKPTSCKSCHPQRGPLTDPSMPEIRGQYREYFLESLMAMDDGERVTEVAMHKGVSATDAEAHARVYAGLSYQPRTFPYDPEAAKRGRMFHDKYCEKCHAEGGRPLPDEEFFVLAGQSPSYLRWRLENMLRGDDVTAKKMKKKLDRLQQKEGEQGLDSLLQYYSSQLPAP